MGRAPCCQKVGLKKGQWTREEDQILMSFILKHGHTNWRALPKQAGLLRCGKSCRLRWINYLRPDIKRGNFTKEEEDTIIQLHEIMGNKWSTIAARLPGRTDNEIKNVWHTHLKKKLTKHQASTKTTTTSNFSSDLEPTSSQQSYTSDEFSSINEVSSTQVSKDEQILAYQEINMDNFPIIDDTFWTSEEFPLDQSDISYVLENFIGDNQSQLSFSEENFYGSSNNNNTSTIYNESGLMNCGDNMDFWYDVFVKAGGATELPGF